MISSGPSDVVGFEVTRLRLGDLDGLEVSGLVSTNPITSTSAIFNVSDDFFCMRTYLLP